MKFWFVLIIVSGISFSLTWALRRYALAHSLIDVPNERSSHTVPTPRGGGVAIVLAFLLFLPMLDFGDAPGSPLMWGLLGSGALVAVLGFLDDHGHIAAHWRLLGHFTAAAWLLFWLGGLPTLTGLGFSLDLGLLGSALAVLYLVWMLNLYNFMDGIDGISSIEAITVCMGGALIYLLHGDANLAMLPLLLVAAVAGFLCWNFPPAKIFMGDAGSGFLGITLGGLSLQAGWVAPELFWSWLILLGVFVLDATFTLLRRLLRGDKVYEAHRSHAYQFASRHCGGHKPVTLAVLAINTLWLLPIAVMVAIGWIDGVLGVAVAYAPLVWLVVKFHAGDLERQPT